MTGLEHFLNHLRRKVRVLLAMTVAFMVVALFGIVEGSAHRGLDTVGAASLIMSAVSGFVAFEGKLTAQKVERLASNQGRSYVLSTRPYDGPRNSARVPGGVLATLTEIGTAGRSTVAEVRSRWFTPGISEQAMTSATLFGSLEIGAAVLAVDDRGGIVGKITAIRSASMVGDPQRG